MEGVKLREKRKDKTKVKFWGEIPAPGPFLPSCKTNGGERGLHVPACPAAFELQVPACHISIIYCNVGIWEALNCHRGVVF